jgi:hypothetical protein
MLLKTIGLPLLCVLSVLAFPILILLFLFGLPINLVLLVGGLFMGMLGMVLTLGLAAVKIGLFIVLPAWLVWTLFSKILHRGGGKNGDPPKGDSTSGPATSAPADPLDGVDPA